MLQSSPSGPGFSATRYLLVLALAGLAVLQACRDDGSTGPGTVDLEILVLGGDGQSAGPGTLLPKPFRVRVQTLSNGSGREGVKVRWEILEGSGAWIDPPSSFTDSGGVAEARLTLGPHLGGYRVRASVAGMTASPADFGAQAILEPELTMVPEGPVAAGDTVLLEGNNFSPLASQNVVTFSDIRGRVVEASETTLSVEVPGCLPSREVALQVRIGSLRTDARPLGVLGGDVYLALAAGEDRILDASEGLGCFRLPSIPGARYLLVTHSTGTVGGAEYSVQLTGLDENEEPPVSPSPRRISPEEGGGGSWESGPVPEAHWEWERHFRALERRWLREASGLEPEGPRTPSPSAAPAPPQLGDKREFKVLNKDNGFDKVLAEIRHITDHCLIYVDEDSPSGGFSDGDLASFAEQFENFIHPTVTEIFGPESDLDGNSRVIVLFTPGVNRLTPEASDGYVGGFFFGLDLLASQAGSNKGEIFYAVVPDPTGIHGPFLSRTVLLGSLPAILAHEFEHMVHFNQRILQGGASAQDALWLSEALAQMAEDLVGEAYRQSGYPLRAMDYQRGNWSRAQRFLLNPSQVSVLATLPPGTLAERGAGWLLLKHLFGRESGEEFIRTLTSSTRTGIDNVTSATGRDWAEILSDWAGSLFLDGLGIPVRSGLQVQGVHLRQVLAHADGTYPLRPTSLDGSPFSISGSLWSSAADYYILTTPESDGLAVNLSGSEGRVPDPASRLRILVVRLQ